MSESSEYVRDLAKAIAKAMSKEKVEVHIAVDMDDVNRLNRAAEILEVAEQIATRLRESGLISGANAVQKMRNEFVTLVHAYNIMELYQHAMDAQAVAVALHNFTDNHNIETIMWPAAINPIQDGWPPSLAAVNGSYITADEL